MLRRLRRRHSVEHLTRDIRRGDARWTRWVYLLLLLGAVAWGFDRAFGHLLYLRADGLVVAKATASATEYTARIDAVLVKRGEVVAEGQLVAELHSQELKERMGVLMVRANQNRSDLAQLRGQIRTAQTLLSAAQKRYEIAEKRRDAVERLRTEGLLTDVQVSAALNDAYKALDDLQTLRTNLVSLEERIAETEEAIRTAEDLLASMRIQYDSGHVSAPIGGIVGEVHVSPGDVVRPGEPLLEIYSEPRYVIAFLPNGALYDVAPGDAVLIRCGLSASVGRIASIEAVAPELPKEFQKTFQPLQRQQLAYVTFDRPHEAPPLFSAVNLTTTRFPPPWSRWFVEWWMPDREHLTDETPGVACRP
ncbi:MAG: HlyD family secretion protein [Alphaproteobacteria bacterium]